MKKSILAIALGMACSGAMAQNVGKVKDSDLHKKQEKKLQVKMADGIITSEKVNAPSIQKPVSTEPKRFEPKKGKLDVKGVEK